MVDTLLKKRLPPYVSYRTFRNFLDILKPVPARIDRSYWGQWLSGSNGTQIVGALRFLNLIDNEGVPQPRLISVAAATGGQRKELLRQTASEPYQFLFENLELKTATFKMLEEGFDGNFQVAGDVKRKCVKFFIDFCKENEIELSEHIASKVKSKTANAIDSKKIPRKRSGRTNKNLPIPEYSAEIPIIGGLDKILLQKFPELDPAWPDDVKIKWFDAFDQILKRVSTSR